MNEDEHPDDVDARPAGGGLRGHYVHGHADAVLRSHRNRTAANSAAYLLPHLRPGLRLLDVGCGPGTISVDLASRVSPAGQVVAIDASADVVEQARSAAAQAAAENVEVLVADVYGLRGSSDPRFADGSFDVVHAHQVLQHLPDPVAALRVLRRLRAPDGLVAARDADYGLMAWYPDTPGLEEWRRLYRDLARGAGGEPDAGRRLHVWAREAGFARVVVSTSTWCYADPQARAWWAGLWADRIVDSSIAREAVARGAATPSDLTRLREAWLEWGEHRDGWFVVVHGEILAWG